jgi:hypothetical protein
VNQNELVKLLSSDQESFLKRLKAAALNELEYWEARPTNLSRELFERYIKTLDETRALQPAQKPRESRNGKHGQTGFQWVFAYEDSFRVAGQVLKVYVKGFFFEESFPRGVEIQSFTKSSPKLRSIS